MIVPILTQTAFNYSYLVSTTETKVIADRIPVFGARTVNLSLRIHKISLPGGGQFQVLVYGTNPSSTDGLLFVTSATIGSTAGFSTGSPNLIALSTVITEPAHPCVRVVLQITGPGVANTVYAELSADLVIRMASATCRGTRVRTGPMFGPNVNNGGGECR